jgi:hypothetical protein
MRSATRAFAVVFALGLVALLLIGLGERRSLAFTLGVQPAQQIYVRDGATLCEAPIEVEEAFSALRLTLAAAVVSGPPATVEVFDARTGERLAEGEVRRGYPSRPTQVDVPLRRSISQGHVIRVCVSTRDRKGLLAFGNASAAVRGSSATLNGKRLGFDLGVVFLRGHDTSVLGLTGDIVRRASLFHGGWVGAWTFWCAALLLMTAFPALLLLALRRAGQPTDSASE